MSRFDLETIAPDKRDAVYDGLRELYREHPNEQVRDWLGRTIAFIETEFGRDEAWDFMVAPFKQRPMGDPGDPVAARAMVVQQMTTWLGWLEGRAQAAGAVAEAMRIVEGLP